MSEPDRDAPSGSELFRGTGPQDQPIEHSAGQRLRRRALFAAPWVGAAIALIVLISAVRHFAGTQNSVDRARLTIATVERGSFVRDVEADGQVVAAVSPTLYAPAAGTVALKAHAGDAVQKGLVLIVLDSPDLTAKLAQEQ